MPIDAALPNPPLILIALRSADALEAVEFHLAQAGCRCRCVDSIVGLTAALRREPPTLAVVDLELDGQCGIDVCRSLPPLLTSVPVVFHAVDAVQGFEKSLDAMRQGALDVLLAPLSVDKLEKLAARAFDEDSERRALRAGGVDGDRAPEVVAADTPKFSAPFARRVDVAPMQRNGHAKASEASHDQFAQNVSRLETFLYGSSPAMAAIRRIIAEVAAMPATVMIHGESGTGKELVASAIHRLSNRSDKPFVPVNMATIPQGLAESTLFGHEKGSFTTAVGTQIGWCEAANGGTLFLDEICEMESSLQPKLLRFLQESTVQRVGAHEQRPVDVRVITATNRDLGRILKDQVMREDLFYRLHVVPIHLPPLRERHQDVEQLALLFLERAAARYRRAVHGFTDEAMDLMRRYHWPGNVRQLENLIERIVIFARGELIEAQEIPQEVQLAAIFSEPSHAPTACSQNGRFAFNGAAGHGNGSAWNSAHLSPIQRHERTAIIDALHRVDGHVVEAAKLLGLGQAIVYRKIKQYVIPHTRRRRASPK